MSLTSITMAMVVGHTLQIHNGYFNDALRIRINSNLRTATDVISMNIRQAGENLPASFPALLLQDLTDGTSDTLTLRRSLLTEVLTVCSNVTAGNTTVLVSSNSSSETTCIPGNVNNNFAAFEAQRADLDADGDTPRLYFYNSVTGTGEFVTFESSTQSGGQHLVITSGVTQAYPALTSNIYFVEQYQFSLFGADSRLELVVNDLFAETKTVAFAVEEFQVDITLQDGTILSAFDNTGGTDWQDIAGVTLSLNGEEQRKNRTFESGITATYFPRNILSR